MSARVFIKLKRYTALNTQRQKSKNKKKPNRIPQKQYPNGRLYDAIISNRTLHTLHAHAHNTTLLGRVQQSSLNRHHNINRHYHTEQSRLRRYGVYLYIIADHSVIDVCKTVISFCVPYPATSG